MKKLFTLLFIALPCFFVFSTPTLSHAQNLGTCLVDSLNGKERKQLAQWIYFGIAAHPEMAQFANISSTDRISIDKRIGTLVTRLLTEDCGSSLAAAQQTDPMAINKAFELVGQVAMQELMNDQSVNAAITNYARYADMDKISAIIGTQ